MLVNLMRVTRVALVAVWMAMILLLAHRVDVRVVMTVDV